MQIVHRPCKKDLTKVFGKEKMITGEYEHIGIMRNWEIQEHKLPEIKPRDVHLMLPFSRQDKFSTKEVFHLERGTI